MSKLLYRSLYQMYFGGTHLGFFCLTCYVVVVFPSWVFLKYVFVSFPEILNSFNSFFVISRNSRTHCSSTNTFMRLLDFIVLKQMTFVLKCWCFKWRQFVWWKNDPYIRMLKWSNFFSSNKIISYFTSWTKMFYWPSQYQNDKRLLCHKRFI